jgi:hypothetical protein
MTKNAETESRELHEFYIVQINNLIAQGRESLIDSLSADYEQVRRERFELARTAA